ncbi:PREDICTED: protein escargot-like [Ceratosolen solmsi marchali]|uniref:Protein escargot-like n=1 Tax=Ceratosolen solmsi marchali TaxID=326594 RepID=A0AAJ7E1U2_9HYME|nr:PREDICTED: protein escargot-like [Ceratosolen solmsi marchali]
MLVDEMPRSFVKKNNSYSHCPLKKRPVNVMLAEDLPKTEIKEEVIEVVDEIPEPENLSTKPEDLSRSAPKRPRSPSPALAHYPVLLKRSPSPSPTPLVQLSQLPAYQPRYPSKATTPPTAVAPVHPVAKRARVEVLQHDNSPSQGCSPLVAKSGPPEPLTIGGPIDSIGHYPSPGWPRATAAPLYPAHYLPYPTAYRYHGADLYPAYPVPAYPHSSPEHHRSVSPSPPHAALTCPAVQRPVVRGYAGHWASPEHCGLSPTGSIGSLGSLGSLGSPPPPVSPEDLSSPCSGSDSGRSSAGSTSAGPTLVKLEKNSASPRYQCPDCAKSYSTYSGLSKHQQFHCAAAEGQTKKTFTCKYCEKVYLTLGALKMHIRTHTLPCKCHLCGKAFSRPWLLQGHIRTHTGEKPFSCQHCNRAFADRSNLRAHLQTHSDVKKYSCSSCSKTFSRMSLLTKHQEGGCPGVAVPIGSYGC